MPRTASATSSKSDNSTPHSIAAPDRIRPLRECEDRVMDLEHIDWDALRADVDRRGFGVTSKAVLNASECAAIARTFEDDAQFRSTIDMARYRFGEGCYRYYASPL